MLIRSRSPLAKCEDRRLPRPRKAKQIAKQSKSFRRGPLEQKWLLYSTTRFLATTPTKLNTTTSIIYFELYPHPDLCKRCIFDALLFNPACAKVPVHKSGVLPVQACRRPQSFLRKLQRLSRRTGVNAHSTRPQAKCRSCCPHVAEQCCPRGAKSSVLRAVCCRR